MTKKKKSKVQKSTYSNLVLIDNEGNTYSANPSDYFMMKDKNVFKDQYLAVTEYKKGWTRTKVVKNNPSKADLIKWNKKVKTYI